MATRSTIGIKLADGRVRGVYCHWDGYLSNNGVLLLEHYQDPAKVQALIDLGNISSLGSEIGEEHLFDNPYPHGTPENRDWQIAHDHMTTFYGRDRGEANNGPKMYADEEAFLREGEEYDYLFDHGVWYVSDHGQYLVPLHEAIEKEQEEDHA